MTDMCVCGHHSHDHASDPSGSGMTDCWHGDSEDSHGYPINKCQCREYAPAGEEITA